MTRRPSSPTRSRRRRRRPRLPRSLAGCAVGPNYKRPEMPTPAARASTPVEAPRAGRPQSLADVPWWEVFEDPELQDLIREAIANNLDLRTAAARVVEARAQRGRREVVPLPRDRRHRRGYTAQQVSRLSRAARRTSTATARPTRTSTPASRSPGRSTSSAASGARTRRRSPRYLATEQGRRGVAHHARGRRRVRPTSCCASSTSSSRSPGARCRLNDETVGFYENRARGRRLEPARGRPGRSPTGPSRPSTIPDLERQIALTENALCRAPRPARRGRSSAAARSPTQHVPAAGAGGPARDAPRAPPRRARRPSSSWSPPTPTSGAAKALFFPTISPDRPPRRREPRPLEPR